MKVTGIIMECNPFHEGHAYLLRQARRLTQADYIVVAMSGDFVQRGEPAVFDKYIRAEQILRAGADLVLELPLYAACGSAEYFAHAGIALLDKLGVVTDLCFGSESGDIDHLQQCARILSLAEDGGGGGLAAVYRDLLQDGLRKGMSFPAARAAALKEAAALERNMAVNKDSIAENCSDISPRTAAPGGNPFEKKEKPCPPLHFPSVPNDLLAVEYCRVLRTLDSSIRPHAIRRIQVPSATQHRKDLLQNRGRPDFSSGILPQITVTQVPLFPLGPDDFSAQLLYALRMYEDELEEFADVSPDLALRIRKNLGSYRGFSDFCDLLKTRNLTRTRVSRCLLHILLQIRKERLDTLKSSGMVLYARPLALSRSAAPLLSELISKASLPFLSKISAADVQLTSEVSSLLREEFRAEELYCLTLAGIAGSFPSAGSCSGGVPRAAQRKLPVKRT